MAKHVLLICDLADKSCKGEVTCLKLWHEHDAKALSIDVCEHHSEPILKLFHNGSPELLPARPRQRMEPTKLKPTKSTKQLKVPKK